MTWTFYSQAGVQKTSETLGSEFPVGTITDYAGATAPVNWLLCDGSTISRSTYSQLFDVIGTAYGAGDGSTTFKIPNSSGKIIYYQRGPAAVTTAVTNAPTFVTTLPSSPTDGQQIHYQSTALATAGVVYNLRYSTSASKWQFIGGQQQIASTTKTDVFGPYTTNAFNDITGLSVTLTPTFSTSKFLITGSIFSSNSGTHYNMFNLVRTVSGSDTNVAQPAAADYSATIGATITNSGYEECSVITHLDSPATTSNVTYKFKMRVSGGAGYVNRRGDLTTVTTSSNITVQEVVL